VSACRTAFAGAALALLAAAALAGCGFGPGAGTSNVNLDVTSGFGANRIGAVTKSKVPGSETVMRMLERSFRVHTRYGGGFVESIDDHGGSSSRRDWFYYVNGVQAAKGAASTAVHEGDHVWWDLHDWTATDSIPAVVGSFPEPFLHGTGGRRLPTTLECATDVSAACATVSKQLSSVGVRVGSQLLGTGSGTDSLSVLVGTWGDIAPSVAGELIAKGPSYSGVYARFGGRGDALQILDPHGAVVKTLPAGAGLIAATSSQGAPPTWMVIGTSAAGVDAAAKALTATALHDHFALAVQGSTDYPVPLDGSA
jgi:hypothetical protein